jgi:hypothetical protein
LASICTSSARAKFASVDGRITLDNLTPGQAAKFQATVHALGTPASVELAGNSVPAELQPLTPPNGSIELWAAKLSNRLY